MSIKPLLQNWLSAEIVDLYSRPAMPSVGLLTGCPVWGDEYIEHFLSLTVPSLLGERNRRTLANCSRLMLFTDDRGFAKLWPAVKKLDAAGIATQLGVLPEEVVKLAGAEKDNKFWILGTTQQLLIQTAGRYGMGFHAMHPDVIYADGYFARMAKLAQEHPAIASMGFSAARSILPEIEACRSPDGSLSIPAVDLCDMGFRHMHGQSLGNLMNRGKELLGLPTSSCFIWQGRESLFLHCLHANMVYMSPALCARAEVKLFNAVDTVLPHFMPEFPYFSKRDDGLHFIEVSGPGKYASTRRVDVEMWSAIYWTQAHFRDEFTPYFETASEIPIHPQAEYLQSGDIRRRHERLVEELKAHKEIVRGRIRKEAA